jgi:hypothetical protein
MSRAGFYAPIACCLLRIFYALLAGWLLPAKLLAEVAMENSGAFRLRLTQAIRRRNQRKALGGAANN